MPFTRRELLLSSGALAAVSVFPLARAMAQDSNAPLPSMAALARNPFA